MKPTSWRTACWAPAGNRQLLRRRCLRQFEKKPLERAFAVQLVQRLRDLDPKVGPILLWLDERLAAQGTTADEIVRAEHQQQAAMSVTVRNIITSMRLTSAFDWQAFFESVSLVDQVLRDGSNFAEMDFATRDAYRHADRRSFARVGPHRKSKSPSAPCTARNDRAWTPRATGIRTKTGNRIRVTT